jgi:ubiquinone/menaquinone biosynthesis C-methylase UbiE/DNA-binding transcriptional ArsR family regulator
MHATPVFQQLAALADTTRARLLRVLEQHELSVSELCAVVQLPQSTVSRHLGLLRDEGWLATRSEGTSRYYRMSGSLDGSARRLWEVVREPLSGSAEAAQDTARARDVLAHRRSRSQEFFSTAAGRWDAVRAELFGATPELPALLALLGPDWVVGDLGCGTGRVAEVVAPYVERVIGVDESAEMLAAALERVGQVAGGPSDGAVGGGEAADHPGGGAGGAAGGVAGDAAGGVAGGVAGDVAGGAMARVEWRQGRLEALPIADGALDVALLALVLHYVPDPSAALAESWRVLRPGGRVLVVDMVAHGRAEYREGMGHLWQGFERSQVTGWLEAAGFGGLRYHRLPPDPAAKGPLLFAAVGTRVDGPKRDEERKE